MSKITIELTRDQVREIETYISREIYSSKEFIKKYGDDKNERDHIAYIKRIQTALVKAVNQE